MFALAALLTLTPISPIEGPYASSLRYLGRPLAEAKQGWAELGLKEKQGWYGSDGTTWIFSDQNPMNYMQLSGTGDKTRIPDVFGFNAPNAQRVGSSWSALVNVGGKEVVLNVGDPTDTNNHRALMGFAAVAPKFVHDLLTKIVQPKPLTIDGVKKVLAGDYGYAHACFGTVDGLYGMESGAWNVGFEMDPVKKYRAFISGWEKPMPLTISFFAEKLPMTIPAAGKVLGLDLPDGQPKYEGEEEGMGKIYRTTVRTQGLKIVGEGPSTTMIRSLRFTLIPSA